MPAWAVEQDRPEGYRWWELAAGGISSLSVLALLAAAAEPGLGPAEAAQIDAAYFPSVCALSSLLDSLVDYDRDAEDSDFSSVAQYATREEAAERFAFVAADSERQTRRLRQGRRHATIVAGVAGFYLSSPNADTPFAAPIKASVVDGLGPVLRPIMAMMRTRRHGGSFGTDGWAGSAARA